MLYQGASPLSGVLPLIKSACFRGFHTQLSDYVDRDEGVPHQQHALMLKSHV